MAEVKPGIGLVIRHAYLWWNEARQGREEGRKDRPCVIIHQRQNEHGETEVFICPVTHTPPPGGGWTYGLLPAAMTRDLVAQVKRNSTDRSLLVVKRDG